MGQPYNQRDEGEEEDITKSFFFFFCESEPDRESKENEM